MLSFMWDKLSHKESENFENKTVLIFTLLVSLVERLFIFGQFTVTVFDDRGKEMTTQEEPERIAPLLLLYAEILLDMGVEDKIVGRLSQQIIPPGAEEVVKGLRMPQEAARQ